MSDLYVPLTRTQSPTCNTTNILMLISNPNYYFCPGCAEQAQKRFGYSLKIKTSQQSNFGKILQNAHSKHGIVPKEFNINVDTSISYPSKDTFVHHKLKLNSVRFIDPYDHIDPTYNRVVPSPDGTIYLVDINETHYWGSLVSYMYWVQKYSSE